MLNCQLPSLSAKDSFAMVLLHWFRPLAFGTYPSLADLLCGNTLLKLIVLLLKHPRKSGVMVLQLGIACSSDRQGGNPGNQYCMQTGHPVESLCPFLAWHEEQKGAKIFTTPSIVPGAKGIHHAVFLPPCVCRCPFIRHFWRGPCRSQALLHQMAGKQAYRKGGFSPNICLWREVEGWWDPVEEYSYELTFANGARSD